MNNDQLPDDDRFMAQFANRMQVEPNPQWVGQPKQEFPWQELGWAFAAALMLGVYWTELRFGFFMVTGLLQKQLTHLPLKLICMTLAAAIGLASWLGPKLAREEI
jgi:hypothetical protein